MSQVIAADAFDNDVVTAWVTAQLRCGGDLSAALLRHVAEMPVGFVVVPSQDAIPRPWVINDHPATWPFPHGVIERPAFLREAATLGLSTWVIEDDLRREGAPHVPAKTASAKTRLIHWTTLSDPAAALRDASAAASGYPFNSFMTGASAAELGLVEGRRLSPADVDALAQSATLILTEAFDGDAYVGIATMPIGEALAGRSASSAPLT